MSLWEQGFDTDRDSILELCVRDREELTHSVFLERPGFAKKHASVWLEDFLDYHEVMVQDMPLALGQLGLCNMRLGWIFLSDSMRNYAESHRELKALRVSTLAHELGHLRMHRDEDTPNMLVSYFGDKRICHPRAFQREMEADLYAGAFLIPEEALRQSKAGAHIWEHRDIQLPMRNAFLWKALYEAAAEFGVTPTLMKKRLIDLGWIEQTERRKGNKSAVLRLRFGGVF